MLLCEGIFDMIRVDHGAKAYLMLFLQNLLRNERGNLSCKPYIQTQSRQLSRKEASIGVKCTINAILQRHHKDFVETH